MQPQLATSPHEIAVYQDKINNLKAELNLIMERYRIYQKAKEAVGSQSAINGWRRSDKEGPYWRYGEITTQCGVTEVSIHMSREGSCCYRKRDVLTFNKSDKIILGYTVRANWQDKTCGQWKRSSGGLLSSMLDINLESWLSRGYNWSLLLYVGKKSDFNFE